MRLKLDCTDLSVPAFPGDWIEAYERRITNTVLLQGYLRFLRHFRRD